MKTNIIEILQNLEKQSTKNGNTSILKHQIKFCARWSLDNICIFSFFLSFFFSFLSFFKFTKH